LAFFVVISSSSALFAQDRGLSVVAADNLGSSAAIGKQYALFIAIDAYRTWPALQKPATPHRSGATTLVSGWYAPKQIRNEE
jgi:hypothetical protein